MSTNKRSLFINCDTRRQEDEDQVRVQSDPRILIVGLHAVEEQTRQCYLIKEPRQRLQQPKDEDDEQGQELIAQELRRKLRKRRRFGAEFELLKKSNHQLLPNNNYNHCYNYDLIPNLVTIHIILCLAFIGSVVTFNSPPSPSATPPPPPFGTPSQPLESLDNPISSGYRRPGHGSVWENERRQKNAQNDMSCRMDQNINRTLYPWKCDFSKAEDTLASVCPADPSLPPFPTKVSSIGKGALTITGHDRNEPFNPIKSGFGDKCRRCRPTTNTDAKDPKNVNYNNNNNQEINLDSETRQQLNPSPFLHPFYSPFPLFSSPSSSSSSSPSSGRRQGQKGQLINSEKGDQCLLIRGPVEAIGDEICTSAKWIESRSPSDTPDQEYELLLNLLSKYHLNYCPHYTLDLLTTRNNYRGNQSVCRTTINLILNQLIQLDQTAFKISCEFNSLVSRYNCQSGFSVKWNCQECTVRTYMF